jgi:hypothetical protein
MEVALVLLVATALLVSSSTLVASGAAFLLHSALFRLFHSSSLATDYFVATADTDPNNTGNRRVLRLPVGPADGGAADGDRLLLRGRRRLLGHPGRRRLLQPQHRRLALLLGRQQLLPEQQGQGRHLRLQWRRHHLHHRPK